MRIRLPLTDVTGKVRVKEKSSDGFGLPVAPSKVSLGKKHYLEWQIGYDIPNTNSPTIVPEIKFIRNGETKYGHELSKIIFESVRLGILSTNDLVREIDFLKKIQPNEFEESQAVQVEVSTNAPTDGFQSAVQRLPQFTKTTPHGWVQIQLKQKQRAVGYQAMVYVCLPMNEVLDMDGTVCASPAAGQIQGNRVLRFQPRATPVSARHHPSLRPRVAAAQRGHPADFGKILELAGN